MSDLPYLEPEKLFFSSFDDKTLKDISVKCITNPTSLDRVGTPLPGGLYDPALGPHERNEVCATCKQFSTNCPGHFGHIQLPLPVFNPIYFSYLVAVLRSCCFACNRIVCNDYEAHVLGLQIKVVRSGHVSCAQSISEVAESIIRRYHEATDKDGNPDSSGEKIVKKGGGGAEIPEAVLEDVKESTAAVLQAAVKETLRNNATITSSNEYLINLLTRQLKMMEKRKTCPHCAAPLRDVIYEGNTKIYLKPIPSKKIESWNVALKKQPLEKTKAALPWHRVNKTILLTPSIAFSFLNEVASTDSAIYKLLLTGTPPSTLFFTTICVPPVKFRPISVVNDRKYDNTMSDKLSKILSASVQLSSLLKAQKTTSLDETTTTEQIEKYKQIQLVWLKIQTEVNQYVTLIKGVLEKKQGLFRMHMMGKRVNYAARSVISPDPYINCDEVGLPMVFATKLTYPQPVTPWNILELRQAVINGPLQYPGATHVEMEDGKRIILRADNRAQRESIAKTLLVEDKNRPGYNKKVCRHVKTGDVLLLNRQPTLHKISMMAHKARILPNQKTLRLHYSVCKSYNADFDGDEMNAHLPQDEISRAEAYGLMSVNDNYLVPKDGSPIGGLIQDHIVGGILLTQRGRFFTKDQYLQFVYQGLGDSPRRIKISPPTILKPKKMWSGKQIITTILRSLVPPNKKLLTLNGKSSTAEKCWINKRRKNPDVNTDDLLDSEVIIYEGELLCGVMDKGQCGPKAFGLVHCVYEIYGGEIATLLLSAFGRLFTSFLHWRGFSLGIEDIRVQAHGDEERKEILAFSENKGDEIACKVLGVDMPCNLKEAYQQAHLSPIVSKDLGALDRAYRPETGKIETEIGRACMGMNLWKLFPMNNLQLMVHSGAKGSNVNCSQISCMVGQVELEGARPPLMLSGRSLPSYLPYEASLASGGLISSRFLTGITPQELFFNSMAGREGLVDTAVKTSRSGYLQRCLIKHLEGICTSYDHTVRDSDGSVVQFLYGHDGIDVNKTNFLSQTGLKHLKTNAYILAQNNKKEQSELNCFDARSAAEIVHDTPNTFTRQNTAFHNYEKKMRKKEKFQAYSNEKTSRFRSEQDEAILKSWYDLKQKSKETWQTKSGKKKPLPVLSTFPPHKNFGSISERLQTDMITAFTKDTEKDKLKETVLLHFLKGLSQPGDGVGVLAGQSIGEPSTQMTLNTFHFAGRADMNVTMGIPRMREILMTAGLNPKTPVMEIPLKPRTSQKVAKNLAKKLTEVKLSQILEKVDIVETLICEGKNIIQRYKLNFQLLPEKFYKDKCHCTSKITLKYIEEVFIGKLQQEFSKLRRAQTTKAAVSDTFVSDEIPTEKTSKEEAKDGGSEDEEDDERDEGGKRREQNSQVNSYEDDEVDDDVPEPAMKVEFQEDPEAEEEEGKPDDREIKLMRRKAVVSYKYDKTQHLWCEVVLDFPMTGANVMMSSVVEDLARKCLVWKIPGIKRAFVNNDKDDKNRWVIVTDGINIPEIWKHENVVETHDISTNDINKFYEYYGIEAAMGSLIKEISAVFGAYGIKIDNRHLSLVADYMTQNGDYRPFNRIGIRNSSSPLQKISFETCMEFLRRAAFYNEQDALDSPSSCLVLGKVGSYGSGVCEIRQPLSV